MHPTEFNEEFERGGEIRFDSSESGNHSLSSLERSQVQTHRLGSVSFVVFQVCICKRSQHPQKKGGRIEYIQRSSTATGEYSERLG